MNMDDGTPRCNIRLRVGLPLHRDLEQILNERYGAFRETEPMPTLESYCKEVLENHVADWRMERREAGMPTRYDDRVSVEELD